MHYRLPTALNHYSATPPRQLSLLILLLSSSLILWLLLSSCSQSIFQSLSPTATPHPNLPALSGTPYHNR